MRFAGQGAKGQAGHGAGPALRPGFSQMHHRSSPAHAAFALPAQAGQSIRKRFSRRFCGKSLRVIHKNPTRPAPQAAHPPQRIAIRHGQTRPLFQPSAAPTRTGCRRRGRHAGSSGEPGRPVDCAPTFARRQTPGDGDVLPADRPDTDLFACRPRPRILGGMARGRNGRPAGARTGNPARQPASRSATACHTGFASAGSACRNPACPGQTPVHNQPRICSNICSNIWANSGNCAQTSRALYSNAAAGRRGWRKRTASHPPPPHRFTIHELA